MPSIFDILLGRNAPATPPIAPPSPISPAPTATPSILDAYTDKNAAARDTLMGLSQGLIAAGGPSQYPVGMLDAFGKGISGGITAREAGEDKGLKRALIGSQVQKAQADIANEKAWQDMFKTPAAAPVATPPDPTNPAVVAGLPGALPSTPAAWDPHYHQASASTGLSVDLLKAKDAVESGGNANAVSPAGAGGPAQLMPGTAGDLGVTNRFDPAQAIPAGARYLAEQYAKYKDVDKALAAYNWGPGNVDKWIAAGANPALLPAETQKYIADIKARLPPQPTFGTGGIVPIPNATGVGQPTPIPNAVPGQAPGIQLAQAGGGPVPVPGAPPAAAPKTLPQVIQSLPPAVRQMMGAMPRKDALPLLMKYADPETHVAIDTTTGQVVFAPKTDNSGRYVPVDAMKLDLDKQRLEVERRQAAARELTAKTGAVNAPIDPNTGQPSTVVPQAAGATEAAKEKARRDAETAQLTDPNYVQGKTALAGSTEAAKRQAETGQLTDPNYVAGKGGVTGAEASAKVPAALREEQGKLVIKDIQQAQTSAEHARVGTANLSRLGTLLDQVNTNKFAGTTLDLKAAAKAAGIDLDALGVADNVGVAQAAKALSQQLALQLRDPSAGGGMPGSMSDADRQFLTTMVPAITNDPNANKLMLEWQKKIHQRSIEIGKIVNDYGRSPEFLKDPTGVYAKVREYAEKNPLFDPEKDAPKPAASTGGSLSLPPMSAIDAEIARRKKLGLK